MDVMRFLALFFVVLLSGCGASAAGQAPPARSSKPAASVAAPAAAPTAAPETAPGPLDGMVICLDPGHGVTDAVAQEALSPLSDKAKPAYASGASGAQITEEALNLQVALRLRDKLESMGASVILTREASEATVSNIERARIANDAGADCCIRIHADGVDDPSVYGVSVLIPSGPLLGTPSIAEPSAALGQRMADAVAAQTGAKNRGVTARQDLTGFNWSEVPCVLLEMGFLTNAAEEANLIDPAYQDSIALGVAQAVVQWRG